MKMLGDSLRYYTNLQFQGRQQLDKEIENIRASLLLYRLNYAAMIQQMRSANNPVLARAGLYNNLVTNATELPEIIEAILNEAEIAYETGGRASIINFFGQLLPIAQQCPSSGGEAVFRARELIRLVNDSIEYDDASVCGQMGIYRKKQLAIGKNHSIELLLIPNPAKEQVQLILSGFKPHREIMVAIHDLTGRLLDQKSMTTNLISVVLNTANLSNGVYVVDVTTDMHEEGSKKMIINK